MYLSKWALQSNRKLKMSHVILQTDFPRLNHTFKQNGPFQTKLAIQLNIPFCLNMSHGWKIYSLLFWLTNSWDLQIQGVVLRISGRDGHMTKVRYVYVNFPCTCSVWCGPSKDPLNNNFLFENIHLPFVVNNIDNVTHHPNFLQLKRKRKKKKKTPEGTLLLKT